MNKYNMSNSRKNQNSVKIRIEHHKTVLIINSICILFPFYIKKFAHKDLIIFSVVLSNFFNRY